MLKKILLLFIFIVSYPIAQGQELNSRQMFEKAEFLLFNGQYDKASVIYEELNEMFPENQNIFFHLSICYLNIKEQNKKALFYLKKIFSNSTLSSFQKQDDYFIYLNNLYQIDNPEIRINDKGFKFDPLQPYNNICISGNGKIMVFLNSLESKNQIYFTIKENNKWREPVNITSQINSDGNCFPASLSFDGTKLYLSKYDNFESDIWVSSFNGNEWASAKKLNSNINGKYWDSHACESPEGDILYFASNRPGGFGGMDIYFATKDAKKDWGKPVNAGVRINTFINDDYPILTNNGQTLIYSSQGFKKGKDGYDVYYCNAISNNLWSEPVNIGPPVNTPEDDITYVPLSDESQAFFSMSISKKKSAEVVTGKNTLLIRGKIILPDSALNYEEFKIQLVNRADETDTRFINLGWKGSFTHLFTNGDYSLKISATGYATKNVNILIPFISKNDTANIKINIEKATLPVPPKTSHINQKEKRSLPVANCCLNKYPRYAQLRLLNSRETGSTTKSIAFKSEGYSNKEQTFQS